MENYEDRLYRMQIRQLKQYAIFFIDLNGRIKTWNAGVEHLLGYSEAEPFLRDYQQHTRHVNLIFERRVQPPA